VKKRLEKVLIITVGLIVYSGFAFASIPKQGGDYTIITDGICLGGNPSTYGGNYDLLCSVAQPGGIGIFMGGSFILNSGYISQLNISGPILPHNPPHINSISPAWGANTGTRDVIISGENLLEVASVKIVRAGFPDIVSSNVAIIQPDMISCSFDLTNQAYGLWDIMATNTDGQFHKVSEGFSICLPLVYDELGGVAVGSDRKTQIEVSPHTFGEDVYIVINLEPTSNGIKRANQHSNMVRIKDNTTEFRPYSVLSKAIGGDLGKEVTITLSYKDIDGDGIVDDTSPLINERNLKIGELIDGRWEEIEDSVVDLENDTVSAKVNSLSVYVLIGGSRLGASLKESHPYPVPFRAHRHEKIIFTQLPGKVEIKIYDIAGDLVTTLRENDMDGEFGWDVTDDNGNKVCSGVYIYIMSDKDGEKKAGRLVVIR